MTKVIGLSLGYNSSAALVDSREGVILAISEERLVNEKNTKQFPINALHECIKAMGPMQTINIAISSYEAINFRTLKYMSNAEGYEEFRNDPSKTFFDYLEYYIRHTLYISDGVAIKIRTYDHHETHRTAAKYMSGFLEETIPHVSVSADGFGDNISAAIELVGTGEILSQQDLQTSMGLMYQYVTGALGFTEHKHEGKVTGLAALGQPIYMSNFHEIISYDYQQDMFSPDYLYQDYLIKMRMKYENKNISNFKHMLILKDTVYDVVRNLMQQEMTTPQIEDWDQGFRGLSQVEKDIAASIQEYVEYMMTEWIQRVLEYNGIGKANISLSGGLFTNVKVNYKVKKGVPQANMVYVLPPMGDEGTAIGSGIKMLEQLVGEPNVYSFAFAKDELYLGKTSGFKHDLDSAIAVFDSKKYSVVNRASFNEGYTAKIIAGVLEKKGVVCISNGDSEFGPRALGNHTILYDATDKDTNDSLNKRLSRTEFMPFAPITLDIFADQLFHDLEYFRKSVKYMTVAVPCKEEFLETYHAAYHVDGTARPQVLSEYHNPILYNYMKEYTNRTGKMALINTSFNLHNYPIIFDDKVAAESFKTADLDVLILDNVIVYKKGIL